MKRTAQFADPVTQKRWAAIVFAALFLFMAGGFVRGVPALAGSGAGGILNFGTETDFAGFEALRSSARLSTNGAIAANTIMEPLFRMDDAENLLPVLGLSALPADDGRTWTVELRRGVRFHDGTAFNADAVVVHWQRLLNPANKFRGRSGLGPVSDVSRIAEYTVRFHLAHAWLPFKRMLGSARGLIQLIPSPRAVDADIQDRAPVGTGPFRFGGWTAGDAFTVVRNPDYWNPELPRVAEIRFRPMPDDQTRYASLAAGQLDMAWTDRGHLIQKAGEDPQLRVFAGEDNGAEIFILNTSMPPLDDVAVRRALAHALSQARQVEMVYGGSIPVVHHPFGATCACPEDGYRAFDPQKARELLADLPAPVEIEVLHSRSMRGRDIGEITQQMLKSVGIAVRPVGLDFGPVIKKVIGGQYQMSTWRINAGPDQGAALYRMLHSQSRANYARYRNPAMDDLLVAQRMETDPLARRDILCRIARLINADVPIIYRGGMRSHVIARRTVAGIPAIKDGIVRLDGVWLTE